MYTVVGSCPKCGAPVYAPMFHMSILPLSEARCREID